MKHIHHIIPKYMGGSNDPSNLIELTVAEHAEAHKILYEKHGNIEDYCAWKGLEGIMSKEDIIEILCSKGGKKGGAIGGKKSVETHKRNKTGMFNPDNIIQKMGSMVGSSKGGKIGGKKNVEEGLGIFSMTEEDKKQAQINGGKAAGSKNGTKLFEESKGIFNPIKRKEYCSKGGKSQKGFKKHYRDDGDFKMAKPGTQKSKDLLEKGYYLK